MGEGLRSSLQQQGLLTTYFLRLESVWLTKHRFAAVQVVIVGTSPTGTNSDVMS